MSFEPSRSIDGTTTEVQLATSYHSINFRLEVSSGARRADAKFKQRQKEDYDRHHKVRPLPPIADDSPVMFDTKGKREAGKIVSRDRHERSYWVEIDDGGMVRRNRCQLNPALTLTSSNSSTKDLKSDNAHSSCERSDDSRILTRSQTGTKIRPPNRYSPSKT